MKIIAFAGSNSSKSINKKLVTWVAGLFEEKKTEILDLNDFEVTIYKMDREKRGGIPDKIMALHKKIKNCDLIVLSLAEHNGAYSTAFKNIFDWCSRIPEASAFADKPIFLLATSPGARGGATVLEIAKTRLPYNGSDVLETFSLPSFNDNFNEEEGITHPSLLIELKSKVDKVKKGIK